MVPDFSIGDRDVIYLKRPGHGAVKVHFAFHQVNARAHLCGLGRGQGILIGDDVEQCRRAHLQFLLLGVQGLLIQVARLDGCRQSDPGLLQSDLRVANVNCGIIHSLLEVASSERLLSVAMMLLACAARLRIGIVKLTDALYSGYTR